MTTSLLAENPRGRHFISYCIVLIVLSTIFVGMRFWSRAVLLNPRRGPRFWWDDWLCFAALPFTIVQLALVIWRCNLGLGLHVTQIPPDELLLGLKLYAIHWNIWCIAVNLPKLSALAFYSRLFGAEGQRSLRISIWVLVVLVAGLNVTSMLLGTFFCQPVEKFWNPLIPGKCLDLPKIYLVLTVFELVLDLATLLVPIPTLWSLKLSRKRKASIMVVFLLGYSVVVNTIARFVGVEQLGDDLLVDFTYAPVNVLYIAVSWPPTAIFCICVPHMFTLARLWYFDGFKALFTPTAGHSLSRSRPSLATPKTTESNTGRGSRLAIVDDQLLSSEARSDKNSATEMCYELERMDKGARDDDMDDGDGDGIGISVRELGLDGRERDGRTARFSALPIQLPPVPEGAVVREARSPSDAGGRSGRSSSRGLR